MDNDRTRLELPAKDQAEHRVIRDTLGRNKRGPSLDDLVSSGDIDPDSITTIGDHDAFREMMFRLRAERKRQGLSLRDVAGRMGPGQKIDPPALSRLESGENDNPTINTVARYARALNKRIAWDFKDLQIDPDRQSGE